MRRCFTGCLPIAALFLATTVFAQGQPQIASPNTTPSAAQLAQKAKVQNVPEIPYASGPTSLKLPDTPSLGGGTGAAPNPKGHVFVSRPSGAPRLFESDEKG